jgi:hypothetical protein
MKRPTVASLKKVTPENLANLGAERLAAILSAVAETRPDVKRRLRMELAAEQGAEHLTVEIDKRLNTIATSRSKVSWRQRPSFVGDLDVLRRLIAERLAPLSAPAALDRMWQFMDLARRLGLRVRDKDGTLEAVFQRAAGDIGALAGRADGSVADALVEAIARNPGRWIGWLPPMIAQAPRPLFASALKLMQDDAASGPDLTRIVRLLADATGDVDAFVGAFSPAARKTPSVAAEAGRRLLAAGRTEEAGRLLLAAQPETRRGLLGARERLSEPDFDWETVWIDYLEAAGRTDEAQAVRWSSFQRTLSIERAKAFASRLTGFDDVEAESRAFEHAAAHADFRRALQFLMEWPALPEAASLIQTRADEADVPGDEAELWAGRLRARHPQAAHVLLRRAAAIAFRRRDVTAGERLTREADAIGQ